MDDAIVNQKTNKSMDSSQKNQPFEVSKKGPVIDVTSGSSSGTSDSSGSDDSGVSIDALMNKLAGKRLSDSNGDEGGLLKKPKQEDLGFVLPPGFLDPLPPVELPPLLVSETVVANAASNKVGVQSCKQFWKAGDYEGGNDRESTSYSVGMDHVRVHPKFLHSNATSHKWALGAFAELLDNSLDEICNGATYVNVDMMKNKKDDTRMLLVEDNGGGMNPDKMRRCMSLGYSEKSKLANTIGQYGNGFKTSTMRLGADVIVFSRCQGKDGRSTTQTIGMLSYTFLRSTGKEDIVVPMVDYEKRGQDWSKFIRSSSDDWNRNLETIAKWSPYMSEEDLVQQFNFLKDQGTRIIIYNIWEDDQGDLELDFDTDIQDIQIRGVNRDERKIEMAKKYPNSRHFLTYRHSLRSYASILYLRLPPGFRIILRGKDVNHHNLVNDMMLTQKITYRPQPVADGVPKDPNMFAVVTIGFVKDAEDHIDIQGFNVYHKNRLIKPFWRVWNAAGSDGRGVIGVLEANFVEPAHDKQGFERTTVLSRLEARLVVMQKNYWSTNCHKIGYAPRRHLKKSDSSERESSASGKENFSSPSSQNGFNHSNGESRTKSTKKSVKQSPSVEDASGDEMKTVHHKTLVNGSSHKASRPYCGIQQDHVSSGRTDRITRHSQLKGAESNGEGPVSANSNADSLTKLQEENRQLGERLQLMKGSRVADLLNDLHYEKDRCKSIEIKLQEAQGKIEELDKEQEALINIFSEERNRRDEEEENLRKKLKDASNTIEELVDKVRFLENRRISSCKIEH